MKDKIIDVEVKETKIIDKEFWTLERKALLKKLIVVFVLLLCIALLSKSTHGATSVIPEGDAVLGKYTIDCLGEDNLLYIYGYDEDNPDGTLIYNSECDVMKSVKEQYIYQAVRLVIKNSEDSDDRINYEEWFDAITDDRINIKMDTFSEKVCFTIETKKYSDITIAGQTEEQVKEYYKCFDTATLTSNTEKGENSDIVEVYVNNELQKEFTISKPIEPVRITFSDLAFISDDLDDKLNVKIINPAGNTLQMKLLDTNLECGIKSFYIGDQYTILCNKTKNTPTYYMQLQDSNKKIYYGEYTLPPETNTSDTNYTLFIVIGVVVILFIAYNTYSNKSRSKDKTALDQLEE